MHTISSLTTYNTHLQFRSTLYMHMYNSNYKLQSFNYNVQRTKFEFEWSRKRSSNIFTLFYTFNLSNFTFHALAIFKHHVSYFKGRE